MKTNLQRKAQRNTKRKKKIWITLLSLLALFGLLQLTTTTVANPPAGAPLEAPKNVMSILRTACYDCHSNETNLLWFDKIAPVSWLVNKDVVKGRKALNFSEWGKLTPKQKTDAFYNIVNFVMLGAMPLPGYLKLHSGARLSVKELDILKQYAVSQTPVLKPTTDSLLLKMQGSQLDHALLEASTVDAPADTVKSIQKQTVAPAPNGIAYPRGYGNWGLISTTDRFDNQTIRAIFGNAIAVKAIEQNNIKPWPDGTVLAKVLWKRKLNDQGIIMAGDFIHAEFMIKDAAKYKTTKGWGWARWVGKDLKPFGKTAAFTATCTNCHAPVKDNDFVFTMPLKLKTSLP